MSKTKKQIQNLIGVNKYRKTTKGWLGTTYRAMCSNGGVRWMGPPKFSKEEYRNFISTQHHFHALFNAWASGGYSRWDRPSVDRIDNNCGYELSNLRLVTWRENLMAAQYLQKELVRWKKSCFTADDIKSIRKRIEEGERSRKIAQEYGVADATICLIKNRKNWSDI